MDRSTPTPGSAGGGSGPLPSSTASIALHVLVAKKVLQTYKEGDLIPNEWLREELGFSELVDDQAAPLPPKDALKLGNLFQQQFFLLQKELLRAKVMLNNVWSKGYRWVKATDQVEVSIELGEREVRKALRKQEVRLTHVDLAKLNNAQKAERSDALAHTAKLKRLFRKEVVSKKLQQPVRNPPPPKKPKSK